VSAHAARQQPEDLLRNEGNSSEAGEQLARRYFQSCETNIDTPLGPRGLAQATQPTTNPAVSAPERVTGTTRSGRRDGGGGCLPLNGTGFVEIYRWVWL
jgi:hypothetical protein